MEIFKLFGRILVDSDEAEKNMQKSESKASKLASTLGKGIKSAAKWGAGLVAGAGAAGTALMGVATKAAESADEIDKMSQKIGLSKQSYQEWKYAMGQSGVDISVMQTGVKTLTSLMDRANDGNKTAAATFEALGLSIYDSSGKLKNQEDMMKEAIMTLASMEDSTERAKLATELFGKAGVELEPLLNSGAEGIQDLMDRAHDLGLVMSDEAVTAGVVFGDTLADVKDSAGMVVTEIGTAVMPMLQTALDWVLAHLPEIKAVVDRLMYGVRMAISAFQEFWAKYGDLITEKVMSVVNIVRQVVTEGLKILRALIEAGMALLDGDWQLAWDKIVGIVKDIGPKLFNAGKAGIEFLLSGLKNAWTKVTSWVTDKAEWLMSKLTFWDDSDDRPFSGYSHASGLAYVPYDNYPINAHRGEMLLNANDATSLLDGIRNLAAGAAAPAQPVTIVVQSVLDGRKVGESTTTVQLQQRRATGR